MDKRAALSSVLNKTGLVGLFRKYNHLKSSVKILAYHRVLDVSYEDYPFDAGLISASTAQFERQMQYIAKRYKVLPLSEALDAALSGSKNDLLSVTFDDGFDDFYTNGFDIFKKYNVRPTMFLSTGYVDSQECIWTEQLVYAIRQSTGKTFTLTPYLENITIGKDNYDIDTCTKRLLRIMKQVPNMERVKLLDSLLRQLEVTSKKLYENNRMLTWDQIKEMSDWGAEFGSHTVTHTILNRLEGDELLAELKYSKEAIELHTGIPCRSIAYPVGGSDSYDSRVVDMVKFLGYDYACSYQVGINPIGRLNRWELLRLHVEHDLSFDEFVSQLAWPTLYLP